MIKITVDASVLAALKAAFPAPANSAQRALDKYIAAVEEMISDALQRGLTPEQRKLGLFQISLQQLANRGGQIGSQKIRVHKWLSENNLEIVQKVVNGSKFTGQNSLVRLTALAGLVNTSAPASLSFPSHMTDAQFENLLTGNHSSRQELFNRLYAEYLTEWRPSKLEPLFDWLSVDSKSLQAFVYWICEKADKFSTTQKELMLEQALIILAIAEHTNGYFLQRKKPSYFGRNYYEGISVQSVHKELRRAMLGDCWEYDMRSSSVAWKMGFAQDLVNDLQLSLTVRDLFKASILFLEDKADFMLTVQRYTFLAESAVPKDFQVTLLKQAFTAIGFGARANANGWIGSSGQWNNSALGQIIQNSDERNRFLSDATVKKFIFEQKLLDEYIFAIHTHQHPGLLTERDLQTDSGRISKSKVLAYLYQHAETHVMDIVRDVAEKNGYKPLANVHDAIFFKKRLGADLKHEIEFVLHEKTANPYWHLTAKRIDRFTPKSFDVENETKEHKARIQAEEKRAKLK